MFEKCLCYQLTSYFETILPSTLTAYRKNHSGCTTLLRLTEDWKTEADLNNIIKIGAKLIDLSKAFDGLRHKLLLEKLSGYGVSPESLWQHSLDYWEANVRCPTMWSVLGAHLFNIFINDLFYKIKKAKTSAYADDKQLYFSNANARVVQKP